MFDDIFDCMKDKYKLSHVSLIADKIDGLLNLLDDEFIENERHRNELIDAIVEILQSFKK